MSEEFLPSSYTVPESGGADRYFKFEPGDNTFRILAKPILGYEYWVNENGFMRVAGTKPTKGDRPKRLRMTESVTAEMMDSGCKHFWAMPVWNYKASKVQILHVTQKGIQKAIAALGRSQKWGSPLHYDIVVTRTGEGLETDYAVLPEPKEALSKEVQATVDEALKTINLDALYEGGDPFGLMGVPPKEEEKPKEEINIDDIPF